MKVIKIYCGRLRSRCKTDGTRNRPKCPANKLIPRRSEFIPAVFFFFFFFPSVFNYKYLTVFFLASTIQKQDCTVDKALSCLCNCSCHCRNYFTMFTTSQSGYTYSKIVAIFSFSFFSFFLKMFVVFSLLLMSYHCRDYWMGTRSTQWSNGF